MDKEDRTAMHLAAEKGHTSTVEFLAGKSSFSIILVVVTLIFLIQDSFWYVFQIKLT